MATDYPGSPRNIGKAPTRRFTEKRTIFRVKRTKNFSVLAYELLRDHRLLWQAQGILTFLLSHSGEWEVSQGWIEKQRKCTKEFVRKAMHNLLDLGYVRRFNPKDGKGKYTGYEWEVYDEPLPEAERTPFRPLKRRSAPSAANPAPGELTTRNPALFQENVHTVNHCTGNQPPPNHIKPCGLNDFFPDPPADAPEDLPGFAEVLYLDWCKRCGIHRPRPNKEPARWQNIAANAIELHADPVEFMDAMFVYVNDHRRVSSKETKRGPAPWPTHMAMLKWASEAWNYRVDTFGSCDGSENERPSTTEWRMMRKMVDEEIIRKIPFAKGEVPCKVPAVVKLMEDDMGMTPEIIRCAYANTVPMYSRLGEVAADWLRCRRGVLRLMQFQGFAIPPQYRY